MVVGSFNHLWLIYPKMEEREMMMAKNSNIVYKYNINFLSYLYVISIDAIYEVVFCDRGMINQ